MIFSHKYAFRNVVWKMAAILLGFGVLTWEIQDIMFQGAAMTVNSHHILLSFCEEKPHISWISHTDGTIVDFCWCFVCPWWRNQMETFSALLAIITGNSPVNSPHKGQWRGACMFSLICAWINGWVNNSEAGEFRRHRAHYYVTVMQPEHIVGQI